MAKPSTVVNWAGDTKFDAPYETKDTKTAPAGWPTVTKGFVPGVAIASPFVNYIVRHIQEWLEWVLDGSAAADASAHIVETSAEGNISTLGIILNFLRLSGTVTPTTLGATENNYSPPGGNNNTVWKLTPAGSGSTITGIGAGTANGEIRVILNQDGTDQITLAHESASSSAGHRFALSGGNDLVIDTFGMAVLIYDGGLSRWRAVGL